jgi:hypothetical protein
VAPGADGADMVQEIGAFTLLPLSLRQNRRPNAKVLTFDGYHALSALLGRPRDIPTCGFPPH